LGIPFAITSNGPPVPRAGEEQGEIEVTASLSDAVHVMVCVEPTTMTSPLVLGASRWAVGRTASTNVAVIDLSEFMTTVSGFAFPLASPLQPLNVHPGFAVAVSWTDAP
jgi:hypothetical protein